MSIPNIKPDPDTRTFQFKIIGGTELLSFIEGRKIRERQITVPGLNILKYQNAWAGVAIGRNEGLVEDNPTREPFLFQTPMVCDVNDLVPNIGGSKKLDIALLGNAEETPRSLADNLTALLTAAVP